MLGQPRGRTDVLRRMRVLFVVCAAAACVGAVVSGPAFAQRYPPFSPPPDHPTPPAHPTPRSGNSEFFNAGGSGRDGASGSTSSSRSSASSNDDEPSCSLGDCLRFAGQVGNGFVVGRVQEQGQLRVAAVQGCCESNARVDIYMESERILLGTVRANDEGSYFGQFTVPASIEPGVHHLIADIEGCGEFRAAIEVLDPNGVRVLGTSTRNTSGSSDNSGSGVLPATGQDVMRILLLALLLIASGSLLIVLMRRFSPAYGVGVRSGGAVAALPPPEVPFIDTSRFQPYRSAPGQRLTVRDEQPARRPRATSAWDRTRKRGSES